MTADKRRSKRRRVCYQAQILIDSATAPIEALVRDLSETGAALRVPDGQSLPRGSDFCQRGYPSPLRQ